MRKILILASLVLAFSASADTGSEKYEEMSQQKLSGQILIITGKTISNCGLAFAKEVVSGMSGMPSIFIETIKSIGPHEFDNTKVDSAIDRTSKTLEVKKTEINCSNLADELKTANSVYNEKFTKNEGDE